MDSIFKNCLQIVRGNEKEFVMTFLGIEGSMSATLSDLDALIDGLATAHPQLFIKAVGTFLYNYEEEG